MYHCKQPTEPRCPVSYTFVILLEPLIWRLWSNK